MITTLSYIMIAVAAGAFVYFLQAGRQRDFEEGLGRFTPLQPMAPTIENVGPGGVIRLERVGPDLLDMDLKATAKHTYRQGSFRWYELELDKGEEEKLWLEVERDDYLELSLCVKMMDLRDVGLKPTDLEFMEKEDEGELTFEGERFFFEEAGSAVFHRNGVELVGENFQFWDFENKAGDKLIGVEKWDDDSYDVSLSVAIKPSQVEVYSAS
jgi:hypothetical protein